MALGLSIHLGLNLVDPNQYGGWNGQLYGCHNDARAMQAIAQSQGFSSTMLLDSECTADELTLQLGQAAQQLSCGDSLLLTYSGHGGQVPDVNGDETDSMDETWVLYDREFIDDEIRALLSQFSSGVHVFIVSDSCHSGTVARTLLYRDLYQSQRMRSEYRSLEVATPRFRLMPLDKQQEVYRANKCRYRAIQYLAGSKGSEDVSASVVLLSGCLDSQLSSDGTNNGLFTEKLLEVWSNGSFQGNYTQFWKAILAKMPPTQTPNLDKSGASDDQFFCSIPFTIGGGTSVVVPSASVGPTMSPVLAGASAVFTTPPSFTVNTGGAPYYCVEFATDASLFDYTNNGSRRTSANFYGSWMDTPLMTSSTYTMPQSIWNAITGGATRIYYRIGTSTNASSWENYKVSTPDANYWTAPSFEVSSYGRAIASQPMVGMAAQV